LWEEIIMDTIAIILAAGQGTRMKSHTPKVLHPLLGKPLVHYSVDTAKAVTNQKPIVVIGHGSDEVKEALGNSAQFVTQEEQLGTGHAVRQAESILTGFNGLILVVSGDMPLLRKETLASLIQTQAANSGPMTLLTVKGEDSRGFGRIIRSVDNSVSAIVEEAQATLEELSIKEYNVGAYCFRSDWLWQSLKDIQVSPKGEYYLTDIVEIARNQRKMVKALSVSEPAEAMGINTRLHLAEATAMLRKRINERWMNDGVTIVDPASTYIEPDVLIGKDTTIWPNTYLKGRAWVGENCQIGPNSIIQDSVIGHRSTILASVMEYAIVENDVEMGPFCHLRKGAHLASQVHMGNFGEVKDSYLGQGTKMGHFSYIGNAKIGQNVNIGAGTITCNYDGTNKNTTEIGADVFIGSDTMLVAPVKLGIGARTGAGSVVTHDVPPSQTVVGVPARPLKKKGNES
jgi:bifunctional UDP-N-acetylglucosamine pyrophosphorylase/glucosamine-1-phosphate N-acetyltransferase